MMRSRDFERAGGMPQNFPNLIFADYRLWLTLCVQGYLAIAPETCFSYRLNDSVSKKTDGQLYAEAFERYISFLKTISVNDEIQTVLSAHAKQFLLFFCESLSHRLLKTMRSARRLSVKDFVEKCRGFAAMLIPGQPFHPYRKTGIILAALIDSNFLSRQLFRAWKSKRHR